MSGFDDYSGYEQEYQADPQGRRIPRYNEEGLYESAYTEEEESDELPKM